MKRVKFGIAGFATIATGLIWSAYAGSPPSTRPAFHPPVAHLEPGLPRPNETGVMEWKDYDQMHDYFVEGFVNSPGFGRSRMVTPRDLARLSTLYIEGVWLCHWGDTTDQHARGSRAFRLRYAG